MPRLGDKLQPIAALVSLRSSVRRMLVTQTHNAALLKSGKAHQGMLADMRKSSIEYLELSNEYQAQLSSWKNSMFAFNYRRVLESLEEEVAELRRLSKFILQESTCLL